MNIWDTDYLFLFQIWTLQCQTARIKRLHDYYVVDIGRPVPLGLSPTMRMAFFTLKMILMFIRVTQFFFFYKKTTN